MVLSACGAEDGEVGSSTTAPPVPTSDGTVIEPTTTNTQSSTTTSGENTTTTGSSTTTTIVATITDDPYLPDAAGRNEVPWAEVGFGWNVVLFDSSKAAALSPSDVREGPVVLYLVDAGGRRYEVASWPAADRPYSLVDATPSAALVVGAGATMDDTVWTLVDLPTGVTQVVHSASYPDVTFGWGQSVKLTRPTGANVVVYRSDGVDEWVERRSAAGAVLATLYRQEYVDAFASLRWMYGYDGTFVLVSHHGGIAMVGNDGTPMADLWVPQDNQCEPVRWWDADTFLATCYGRGPGSAPLDEYGDPHTYYGRLWLLETDGTAGSALTEYPEDPVFVGDFGYSDAWRAGPDTPLQWTGDCGAAHIAELQPDGTGSIIDISMPPSIVADGAAMVDVNVVAGLITVYGYQGCAGDVGALFVVDFAGNFVQELVPVVGDSRSVIGAIGLGNIYP
jgi:TolB protein